MHMRHCALGDTCSIAGVGTGPANQLPARKCLDILRAYKKKREGGRNRLLSIAARETEKRERKRECSIASSKKTCYPGERDTESSIVVADRTSSYRSK